MPSVIRRVEDAEEPFQPWAKVRPILAGLFDDELEGIGLEDARVFSKQAKQDADQKPLELVARVAALRWTPFVGQSGALLKV